VIVVGLTGSIGMGKSETARMVRRLGIPVFDADAAVHALTARGGAAVAAVGAAFPGSVKDGAVDRAALGPQVLGDPAALKRLERILHPLVGRSRSAFLARARRARRPMVVLDIPLLFETRGDRRVDATIVVSAPYFLQTLRVLRRANMTPQKLADTRARQVPDAIKRRRADHVIRTGLGRRFALDALRRIVAGLKA
jgi:dephospho-CoA kinase